MIAGLDSATPPSLAQAQAARAAGRQVWGGYLQSKPGVGLYRPWRQFEFDAIRQAGMQPIAYCSGWDDPGGCRALARLWNLPLVCLDVESGIRGDGSWKGGWLAGSGAGLYGNSGVHNVAAPFYILAGYYGFDPHATWRGNPPPAPHAWQWQGTHSEFGVGVDSTYFDDFFASGTPSPGPGPVAGGSMSDTIFGIQGDAPSDGRVWLIKNPPFGPKRYVPSPGYMTAYAARMTDTKVYPFNNVILGTMEDESLTRQAQADAQAAMQALVNGSTGLRDQLSALATQVSALQPGGPSNPAASPAHTHDTSVGTVTTGPAKEAP